MIDKVAVVLNFTNFEVNWLLDVTINEKFDHWRILSLHDPVLLPQLYVRHLPIVFDANECDKNISMIDTADTFVVNFSCKSRVSFMKVPKGKLLVNLHQNCFEFCNHFRKRQIIQVDASDASAETRVYERNHQKNHEIFHCYKPLDVLHSPVGKRMKKDT